jgi:hypothetical protein
MGHQFYEKLFWRALQESALKLFVGVVVCRASGMGNFETLGRFVK